MSETKEFEAYSVGLCYASVCTCLPLPEATERLNQEYPTGISNRWKQAEEDFQDGTENGVPCHDHPETHRHLLFSC